MITKAISHNRTHKSIHDPTNDIFSCEDLQVPVLPAHSQLLIYYSGRTANNRLIVSSLPSQGKKGSDNHF